MTYPDDVVVRKVCAQGDIKWQSRQIYLSDTLAGELVGLRQTSDHVWDISFGPIQLARLDTSDYRLIHLPRTRKKQKTNEQNEKTKE